MSIDWTSSMIQTYEYYKVDPSTWEDDEKLECVLSSSLTFDAESSTLGSASFEMSEFVKECYIRTYLVAIQNGEQDRIALGTFLAQTPGDSYDGKIHKYSLDGDSPIKELSETMPEIGYYLRKKSTVMYYAYRLIREKCRAPIVYDSSDKRLDDAFVSNTDDTWLTYISDLIAIDNKHLEIDGVGKIMFAPTQELDSLIPMWTYNDDNSSILYPSISIDRDIYDIPNVVEVIASTSKGYIYATAENNDISSEISIRNRGRRIMYRDTNPSLSSVATQAEVNEYAKSLLKQKSSIEFRISYTHGYCPVRVNDCVLINYEKAGIINVKAKVVSQTITCGTGCSVEETAVFTKSLWG